MRAAEIDRLHSRFRGSLIGAALGDAFGVPFEGSVSTGLLEHIAARASTRRRWSFSDDTQMMVDLARSLVEAGALDQEELMTTLRRSYDPVRGYGKGMKLIFRAMDEGRALESLARVAWAEGSRGNGGVVRLPPLACFYHLHDEALLTAAKEACFVTHAHAEAVSASMLFAAALDCLLGLQSQESFSWSNLLNHLRSLLVQSDPLRRKIEQVDRLLSWQCSKTEAVKALGQGVLACESFPAALYAFCAAPKNFEETVCFAVSLGGDTDTIGSMSGALAGALYGFESIPDLWLGNLENRHSGRDEILSLADQILASWLSRFSGES